MEAVHVIHMTKQDVTKELTRVVVLNGPPGCGKDHYTNSVSDKRDVAVMRFSSVLKAVVGDATQSSFTDMTTKQDKIIVNGKSLRQHQIDLFLWLSERFGENVLGKIMSVIIADPVIEGMREGVLPIIIMPDGGRGEEVEFLANHIGKENMLIIQIERDGYTFEGDIRQYINVEGVTTKHVVNDGSARYTDWVNTLINEWVMEWVRNHQPTLDKYGITLGNPEGK